MDHAVLSQLTLSAPIQHPPVQNLNRQGLSVLNLTLGMVHSRVASASRPSSRRRKRNWEFRVQGRFKRVPTGDLYVGPRAPP